MGTQKQLKLKYGEEGMPPAIKTDGDPVETICYFVKKLNLEEPVKKRL